MIDKRIKEELDIIYSCVRGTSYDWIQVKKILIRSLPSDLRKGFSRRDEKTKVPNINDYELEIIEYWNDKYIERLPLRGDEQHE